MDYETVDWNIIWKDLYSKNVESRGRGECATIWESKKKAQQFLERSREDPERVRRVIRLLKPNKRSRVLDIGAGPGTLAVPIAQVAGNVTAVEPASGMAGVMKEYAKENGIRNLKIINKRWEDIDTAKDLDGPYDIVFASHSLGMPDIRAAIEKMNAVSAGKVSLFWFGGITSWERSMVDLWPQLHGRDYHPGPKADVLFNVLWSMGIYPEVTSGTLDHNRIYADIDTALEEMKDQLVISTPQQKKIVRSYLEKTMVPKKGQYILPGTSMGVCLWWCK